MKLRLWVFSFLVFGSFRFLVPTVHADDALTLRVMAINPSKEESQPTEIRAYLPKEIQPEDILDKGDLEIAYDSQESAYFVHGQYELKPGETLEREIRLKDIWLLSAEELESMRSEATKTAKLLENTDFKERAEFLKTVIETKLNKITERQQSPSANPDRHISAYRDNLALLDSVKSDLVAARSLLTQAKPKAEVVVVWRLFVGVVVVLGLLSLSFYIIWHKQLKTITAPTFGTEPTAEPAARIGERRQAKDVKPIRPDDLEQMIKS